MTASLGMVQPDSGLIKVDCGIFCCTFFPGHLFPVYFRAGNTEFPSVFFEDYALYNGHLYRAEEERWAEQSVQSNTQDEFDIICSGVFCRSDTSKFVEALKNLNYTRRYKFKYGRPSIEMEISLAGALPEKVELLLNKPVWRFSRRDCSEELNRCRILCRSFSATDLKFHTTTELRLETIG